MSSDSVEFRRAIDDDIVEVMDLLTSNGLPTDGVRELGDRMIVAWAGGRVVGAAGLEVHGQDGLLRSVVVADDRRGRGLGQALVHKVMDLARLEDLRDVYLLTEGAGGYFDRLGFERLDRASITSAVTESAEFSHLCPSTAVAMVSRLRDSHVVREEEEGNAGAPKR
ncbi:MAG: arsenic resistance N-acetyltransferase ArsN2 [Rhodothermales bacterium]|nr:arsenic resistance N-acetyltransferase ArsN2 [Rhodothermales bacterium]